MSSTGPTSPKKKGKKKKGDRGGPPPGASDAPRAPAQPAPEDDVELEPIAQSPLALALLIGAVLTVFGVSIWFKIDVNRVFDVPKALVLKVGGAGLFFVWLMAGLFGRGFSWRSFRLFAAPVFALAATVVLSTLTSLDSTVSLYGVYERQFGLQGFLGCVGLYAVVSSSLASRRGALFGLSCLTVIGGLVGSYALLQATGADPFPFFHDKPHNKVYSFLGNATFAGNALALIFPVSVLWAGTASARAHLAQPEEERIGGWVLWLGGFGAVLALQLAPGFLAADNADGAQREAVYRVGAVLSLAVILAAGAFGSSGPAWLRLSTQGARQSADSFAAGTLGAAVMGIFIGLVCTRTRGAWVGSIVAGTAALVLFPVVFRASKRVALIRTLSWGLLASLVLGFVGFLALAEDLCEDRKSRCRVVAATFKSIPAAFDPDRRDYGKGQGTRKYLWLESPRVLVDHEDTLKRLYEDRTVFDAEVDRGLVTGVGVKSWGPFQDSEVGFDTSWRSAQVWLTGIGIEAYRFAFMSHKSKRLEALDPMTNHDNPHNNYLYVLASFGILGLLAYLWLLLSLLWQSFRRAFLDQAQDEDDRPGHRAVAFGVVLSFFSYAVYSIAGFDSVACSVYLFFLLGCAAAFFEPVGSEPSHGLLVGVRRHFAIWRKKDPTTVPEGAPAWANVAVAVLGGALLLHTVWGGIRVYRAEKAMVGEPPKTRDRVAYYSKKAENIRAAIRINPNESFYWQRLGSTELELMKTELARARQLARKGDNASIQAAKAARDRAKTHASDAKVALYSALAHAWAPENIYISLFQVYYHLGQASDARQALERALRHSPHLGAVRANLAALQMQANLAQEALDNAMWVLEIDNRNAVALRTSAQAYAALGNFRRARIMAEAGVKRVPKKEKAAFRKLVGEIEAQAKAATSTSS